MIIDVRKNQRNGWEAKTVLDFEGDQLLTISTSKSDGGITTRASVSLHKDGIMTHAFSLGRFGCGDYSKTVLRSTARATRNAVTAQHTEALKQAEGILAEAREHYAEGAKGAKHLEDLRAKPATV